MAPSSSLSPPAADVARASKKRKTAPELPPRPASRCSLCSFAASTLDHLLTHVRETHRATATTFHMGASVRLLIPSPHAERLLANAILWFLI